MSSKSVMLKDHPLRNEILEKLDSGEITIGTGPIDTSVIWDEKKEEEFRKAMEIVNAKSLK